MTIKQIRDRYLVHSLLHKFTEDLFFAFGALLIYTKTGSILATLAFPLIGSAGNLLVKSFGYGATRWLYRRLGLAPTMAVGLCMKVAGLCGIFYLDPSGAYFYPLLFGLHAFENAGSVFYIDGANAVKFEVIGTSKTPGRSSAQIMALHTVSGVAAALVGIMLSSRGSFLSSFLVGAGVLLMSALPLRGLPTPRIPKLTFRKNVRQVSLGMFLANINPNHQIRTTGLPLVILFVSASLDFSIWLSAVIAAVTIAAVYVAGRVRDHHGAWLTWVALAGAIIAWGLFGFARTGLQFLIPSILLALATEVISIGREARMSTELEKADNVLGGTMAIEFARSLGAFIGAGLLLIAYLAAGRIPQELLIVAGLFLIPKAIYAARK